MCLTLFLSAKLLDLQADHMFCSTNTRVDRLKEVADKKYETSEYRQRRRAAILSLDSQFDIEEKQKTLTRAQSAYYSHPVSVSTEQQNTSMIKGGQLQTMVIWSLVGYIHQKITSLRSLKWQLGQLILCLHLCTPNAPEMTIKRSYCEQNV